MYDGGTVVVVVVGGGVVKKQTITKILRAVNYNITCMGSFSGT